MSSQEHTLQVFAKIQRHIWKYTKLDLETQIRFCRYLQTISGISYGFACTFLAMDFTQMSVFKIYNTCFHFPLKNNGKDHLHRTEHLCSRKECPGQCQTVDGDRQCVVMSLPSHLYLPCYTLFPQFLLGDYISHPRSALDVWKSPTFPCASVMQMCILLDGHHVLWRHGALLTCTLIPARTFVCRIWRCVFDTGRPTLWGMRTLETHLQVCFLQKAQWYLYPIASPFTKSPWSTRGFESQPCIQTVSYDRWVRVCIFSDMPWDHTQVFNTVYQSKYSTVMSHPILRVSPSPTQHSVCETLRSFSFTFRLVVSHNTDTPIYVFSSDLVLSLIIKTKTFVPRSNLTGKHTGKVTSSRTHPRVS